MALYVPVLVASSCSVILSTSFILINPISNNLILKQSFPTSGTLQLPGATWKPFGIDQTNKKTSFELIKIFIHKLNPLKSLETSCCNLECVLSSEHASNS